MRRFMRVLALWLLAAAVPLQAFAAASMAACGAGHGITSAAPGSHHADAATLSAPVMQTMAHHHDQIGMSHAEPRNHEGQHGEKAKPASTKCSVCASCCTATALPSASLHFDSVALTEVFAPLVSIGAPAFLTAGLERPPKPFLA